MKYLERGIQTKETRYLIRVMRTIFSTRKRLNDPVLKRVLNYYFITNNSSADKEFLLTFIDTSAVSSSQPAGSGSSTVAVFWKFFYLGLFNFGYHVFQIKRYKNRIAYKPKRVV